MVKGLYKAIINSIAGRFSNYVVQFLFLSIYARLFSPEDFGVIASIHIFVVFFQMIADMGIGPAIINEDKFHKNKRDGVFTVTAIIGAILAITFYFLSNLLNDFYNTQNYSYINSVICVSILFNTLNIVPTTSLNKDVKFTLMAKLDVIVEVLTFIVVYGVSKYYSAVLALAVKPVSQSFMRLVLFWFASKKTTIGRCAFGTHLYYFKDIMKFSLYQFGFNFINYFSKNLDNILIGRFIGLQSLGIYDKSYQLMRYPLMLLSFAISPAIQPILRNYKHDLDIIKKELENLIKRLLVISLFTSIAIKINAETVVVILFGGQWLSVVSVIEIFSLIIPLQVCLSILPAFFQAIEKVNVLFKMGIVTTIVNIIFIILGVYLGSIEYVAIFVSISTILNFIFSFYVLYKFGLRSSYVNFLMIIKDVISLMFIPCVTYFLLSWIYVNNVDRTIMLDIIILPMILTSSILVNFSSLKNVFFK